MRESFAIDRNRLYGFDYENSDAAAWATAWAQNQPEVVAEEELAEETVIEETVIENELIDESTEDEIITEDEIPPIGGASADISAKEAFFEFARGIQIRPPQSVPTLVRPPQVQPHPMPTVPPRPPQVQPHPMPTVPPRPVPQPPRPIPRPPHNFNPHSGSAPRFAPPVYIPQRAPGLRAVDPGAITRCLYSNTYVWLNNRQHFWFFPTFVGRKSIAGYRWMHNSWVFMGFGLNMIDSFFCGGR